LLLLLLLARIDVGTAWGRDCYAPRRALPLPLLLLLLSH
jgi:hypothetical protein